MNLRITAITYRMDDPQGSLKRVSGAGKIIGTSTTESLLPTALAINKQGEERKGFKIAYVESFECDVLP